MDDFASIFKWILGGIVWLASNILTYKLGKRSKIDDLRIKKVYEYAEDLAVALQEDFRDREHLVKWYQDNFSHLPSVHEAADAFDKHVELYRTQREMISRLPEQRNKINVSQLKSAIYLDHKLLDLIHRYTETTGFSFLTDGIGGILYNTYTYAFFSNLTDEKNMKEQRYTYQKIMKKLRKLRP